MDMTNRSLINGPAGEDRLGGVGSPPEDPRLKLIYDAPVNPDRAFQPVLDTHADDLLIVLGEGKTGQAARLTRYTSLRGTGLDAYGVLAGLTELDIAADLAERRGAATVDEAQVQRWSEETVGKLVGTYGRVEAENLLTRVRAFVQQHPALARMLEREGIGSRPDVVIPLVQHIRAQGIGLELK